MQKPFYWLATAIAALSLCVCAAASDPNAPGDIQGVTRNPSGEPLPNATVTIHSVEEKSDRTVTCGGDGSFSIAHLKPGKYELTAKTEKFVTSSAAVVDLEPGGVAKVEMPLVENAAVSTAPTNAVPHGFWNRLAKAYADDWHDRTVGGPDPGFRGYPAPESDPPYPFTVWPYGGSPVIGQPNQTPPPLMQALYSGPNGDWWKASNIQIYGWADTGFNVSTSDRGKFANAPAAYAQIPDSLQLDQITLYVEKVPDTIQTDHFDWGFRFTNIYGLDYRFTTSKGIFSNQLIGENNAYGYDPVMAYLDLYFPHVASGLDVRIGRYISLPDIEAQLAPNNYTYTHSLTYTYDCYTQDGVNTTFKFGEHWMLQAGLSAGCDAAPWTSDAKLTGNACLSYTWMKGGDEIYGCANSINDSKYAYNNLAAYYLTWYHKINSKWHTDTESWYQYMRDVPSIFGSIPPERGSNGAWCNPGQQSCFAPEWAIVNYVEKQFGKKNYLSIRNEFFDDIKGQRTGYKTTYSEHLIGWGHWIGSTILLRPEISYLRAYDRPAFDSGTKQNQAMVAGDLIFFY
jgi:Putative beta-barrel porin-2, OmpL-like. bbp2/Carboxypeptidase regulatory-like domain